MGVTVKLKNKEILSEIAEQWETKRNILLTSEDGIVSGNVYDIINQPYQEILSVLDRGFTTIYCLASQADNNLNGVYTDTNKMRFVNDLATSYIIMTLKQELDKANNTIKNKESEIRKLQVDNAWLEHDLDKATKNG